MFTKIYSESFIGLGREEEVRNHLFHFIDLDHLASTFSTRFDHSPVWGLPYDVTQFWTIFDPLPPSSRFLLLLSKYYRHKILDPPQTVTSLKDDPFAKHVLKAISFDNTKYPILGYVILLHCAKFSRIFIANDWK